MARTFTHTLSLSIGGDTPTWEGEATVSYTWSPGRPATPPSYASGGDPPEPPEIDNLTVTHIDGVPVADRQYGKYEADTIAAHIEGLDELLIEIDNAAAEREADDYADVMERRAEDRRLDP